MMVFEVLVMVSDLSRKSLGSLVSVIVFLPRTQMILFVTWHLGLPIPEDGGIMGSQAARDRNHRKVRC